MRLARILNQDVLDMLPERLAGKLDTRIVPMDGTFRTGTEGKYTVVTYGDYCGVSARSPKDVVDRDTGVRIALVRCMRSAGLLPPRSPKNVRERGSE